MDWSIVAFAIFFYYFNKSDDYFQVNYINIVLILQKYISISGRHMDREDQEKYRRIIEIIDSDDQSQEAVKLSKRTWERNAGNSEVKLKGQTFILKKEKEMKAESNCSEKKIRGNRVQYEDVCSFKDIEMTNNLNQHYSKLRAFLEYSEKNVLFIFGPSGCGKTLLTLSALTSNRIDHEFLTEREEQNQYGESVFQDSIDLIYRMFSSSDKIREKIFVSKDFPVFAEELPSNYLQKYRIFKDNVHSLIANISNRNKYIFLLNSQIYSSYYLLSQASESRAINQLKNVAVIKMQPYGARDMKKIITHFVSIYPDYSSITNQAKVLEEVVIEANGDARKALNIIYAKKIRQISRLIPSKNAGKKQGIKFCKEENDNSNSKSHSVSSSFSMIHNTSNDSQQKEQLKVSIFHALGKLLYAKRYNIYFNPNEKKNKKTNTISCYYTQEELDRLNPKFYFKPVELLEKAHLNINICADLLQQNFLSRYGKVKDISKMYNIFRYFDSYLEDNLNKFQVKSQMQDHLKEILTWGIIVYNKNTVRENSFQSFQRSKNNIYQKIIDKKNEVINTYYSRFRTPLTVIKYSKKDIIEFGYCLKAGKTALTNNIFLQKLIEVIFDNGKRGNSIMGGSIQKEVSVIQDQEDEIASQNCSKLNKITEILLQEITKKSKLIEMMIEDSDESDIDSD